MGIHSRGELGGDGLVRFTNPELAGEPADVALRTLSLDLETTPDAGRILSAALAGAGVEEVHLLSRRDVAGAIVHPEEPALLQAVVARIRALDPDLLLGWNVVDFDLRVLLARCEAYGLPCHLGRAHEAPRLLSDPGPMRQSRAEVPGRMVLDGIGLVRDALRLPDYRLDTVARHVLGRGKRIDPDAPDAAREILRMWREDPEALVAYNLEDARLVPEILAKEGLLDLTVERSRLSGMQLDRVGASIASFDLLYLPELRRRGTVAPSAEPERKQEVLRGGTLLEPRPGLHHRVAVFDFKSLYPSLIRTFSLDPLAHARAGDDAVTAPNGARFSRDEAILPAVLERFRAKREEAKARGERHADQAIKIMMNAMYGVLGAASCRFFDPDISNAITGFGQQILHWTRDAFEAAGVAVLYGDTDSVFVQLGDASDAETLRTTVESRIAERIRADYGVASQLELELEGIFEHLLLPRVRGGGKGSKKRYAGLAGRPARRGRPRSRAARLARARAPPPAGHARAPVHRPRPRAVRARAGGRAARGRARRRARLREAHPQGRARTLRGQHAARPGRAQGGPRARRRDPLRDHAHGARAGAARPPAAPRDRARALRREGGAARRRVDPRGARQLLRRGARRAAAAQPAVRAASTPGRRRPVLRGATDSCAEQGRSPRSSAELSVTSSSTDASPGTPMRSGKP